DGDLVAARMDRDIDAVHGHGHGYESEQAQERDARDRRSQQDSLDALVGAPVVRRRIELINGEVVADRGIDGRDLVDALDLDIEARREWIALAGMGQQLQTRNMLRS